MSTQCAIRIDGLVTIELMSTRAFPNSTRVKLKVTIGEDVRELTLSRHEEYRIDYEINTFLDNILPRMKE